MVHIPSIHLPNRNLHFPVDILGSIGSERQNGGCIGNRSRCGQSKSITVQTYHARAAGNSGERRYYTTNSESGRGQHFESYQDSAQGGGDGTGGKGKLRPLTVLALESSADDSCAGIVNDGRRILSNVVIKQHLTNAKYGGIHPLESQWAHAKKIVSPFPLRPCFPCLSLQYLSSLKDAYTHEGSAFA